MAYIGAVTSSMLAASEPGRVAVNDHRSKVRGELQLPVQVREGLRRFSEPILLPSVGEELYLQDYQDLLATHDLPKLLLQPLSKPHSEIHKLTVIKVFLREAQDLFKTIDELEHDIFHSAPELAHYKKRLFNFIDRGKIFLTIDSLVRELSKNGVDTQKAKLEAIYSGVLSLIPNADSEFLALSGSGDLKLKEALSIPDGNGNIIYANDRVKKNFASWILNGLHSDKHYFVLLRKLRDIDEGKISDAEHGLGRFLSLGHSSKLIGRRSLGTVIEIRIDNSKIRVYGLEHPLTHQFVIAGWSDADKGQKTAIVRAIELANDFRTRMNHHGYNGHI